MARKSSSFSQSMPISLSVVAICGGIFGAWGTHLYWAFKVLMGDPSAGQIILALLGIFAPPIGVLHGIALWFM